MFSINDKFEAKKKTASNLFTFETLGELKWSDSTKPQQKDTD